jgi:exonuclease VII large subunit
MHAGHLTVRRIHERAAAFKVLSWNWRFQGVSASREMIMLMY